DADPRQAAAGNVANDQSRNQRGLRGSLRTTWRLADGLTLEAAAYAVMKDLEQKIIQGIDKQIRNYGAFARLDWEGQAAGRRA
ncbi:hypothetical protein L9G16_22730, partial [Shewanella sp. A25]|nr:hypothetical protein [Shewanella shenzhenensis]